MAIFQNRVFLIGYLGKDPDTHTFDNGDMVTNASLATTRSWKRKGSDEWQEDTTWHRLVFHGTEAVKAHDQLRKGSRLSVEAYIRSRTMGEGSEKRYFTDIVVDRWINLDPKIQGDGIPARGSYSKPSAPSEPQGPPTPPSEPKSEPMKALDDDDEDSLPF